MTLELVWKGKDRQQWMWDAVVPEPSPLKVTPTLMELATVLITTTAAPVPAEPVGGTSFEPTSWVTNSRVAACEAGTNTHAAPMKPRSREVYPITVARREQFMSRPPGDGSFAEDRRLNSLEDCIRDRAIVFVSKVGTILISAGCCANATNVICPGCQCVKILSVGQSGLHLPIPGSWAKYPAHWPSNAISTNYARVGRRTGTPMILAIGNRAVAA